MTDTAFTAGTAESGVPISSQFIPTQGIPTSITSATLSTGVVSEANPTGRFFTEDDLAKAREQEKSKLYPRIDTLTQELERLTKAEAAREAAAQAAADEAAAEERKRIEDETDLRTLFQQEKAAWEQKFEAAEQARLQAAALLDAERAYQALEQYKAERIAAEQNDIMPDLWDMVEGNTQEEIESSIARLKSKTSSILEAATSALQQNRMNMAGSRVTSPAAGPLDTDSGHKTFTAEDISTMSVADYAKNRAALLGQAANQRNKGMFG